MPPDGSHLSIIPRENLDFGLDSDIPKYWFGGNAFKTRFFDALSTTFPEGEKFFITCVRDYRDEIRDPQLQQQVRDFIRQEGQHGMVHIRFNNRLRAQGVRIDLIDSHMRSNFAFMRRLLPRAYTLAQTAAAEHLTAVMCHSFFHRHEILADADPRIRAMYAWHAIEEIEHKAVAFDVLQRVARAGYFTRMIMMLYVSFFFPLHIFAIVRHMLKVDGFSFRQRLGLFARGLWWLYKPGGLYPPLMPHYFAYWKPGFHPWKSGRVDYYQRWVEVYAATGNPIAAGDAVHAMGTR